MVKSLFGTEEAPYAREAIKRCRALGAKIAIATAESCTALDQKEQKEFLKTIGIQEHDQKFCDTCGYYSNKSHCPHKCMWIQTPYQKRKRCITRPIRGSLKNDMLRKIISTAKNKDRVIFFDDQHPNLSLAHSLGIQTQLASSNCHGKDCGRGSGLTKQEFEAGLEKVGGNPEICIFDIDNTLTRGIASSSPDDKVLIQEPPSPKDTPKKRSCILVWILTSILILISFTILFLV